MKENGCVSVIVPVYNAEKYIGRCVASIREQTFDTLEILLIDDGSSDSSGEMCDAFADEDRRITAIHVENGGVSAARNIGLDRCHGDYVAFVDADDYLDPEFVETLLGMLRRDGTSVAVCANDTVREWTATGECVLDTKKKLSYREYWFVLWVWGRLYKRDILRCLRFQEDIKIGEDTLFFGEVMAGLSKLSYTDRILYHYRYNADSAMHSGFSEDRYTEITAWQRLCGLYRKDREKYGDCMAGYVDRCRCMYVLMRQAKLGDDPRCGFLLREARQNYRFVRQYSRNWVMKLYIGFFVLMPRAFCALYRFLLLLHVDELVYGRRNRGG